MSKKMKLVYKKGKQTEAEGISAAYTRYCNR